MLGSIPKKRRDTKEYTALRRKLIGLVALEIVVNMVALLLFTGFALDTLGIPAINFARLHNSILAISPVYISFSLLEMLQQFIHGPWSPISTLGDGSMLHGSDFEESPIQLLGRSSRFGINSTSSAAYSESYVSESSDSEPESQAPKKSWLPTTNFGK